MSISTQISALLPVTPALPPAQAPPAPAIAAVAPAAPSSGFGSGFRPQDHPRGQPPPEPAEGPQTEAHAAVAALLAVAARMAAHVGAAGGGELRAAQASLAMATAAAQQGLEVRGALVVADSGAARLGTGSIYREGTLVAAFSGSKITYMRTPRHVDMRA